MRKNLSSRAVNLLTGALLVVIALFSAGCASSQPQGAMAFGEEWQQMHQGLRDGGAVSGRGQEVSRSLDSHYDGAQR